LPANAVTAPAGTVAFDRISDVRTTCVREEVESRYRCASPSLQLVAG
jgi:hypothetical protein